MKVKGLDGKEHSWIPTNESIESKRSSLHSKALEILKEFFPYNVIVEEVSLPGTKTATRKTTLRADFFIPAKSLIVEVHGEQHFKDNRFFYTDKMEFFKAKARDRDKKEWCDINNFYLIELLFSESQEEWKTKIQNFCRNSQI